MSDLDSEPLGVLIGTREIYDQVIGMRADVQALVQANTATFAKLDDHEARLRSIERWKYTIPTALITTVVSGGVAIYKALGG